MLPKDEPDSFKGGSSCFQIRFHFIAFIFPLAPIVAWRQPFLYLILLSQAGTLMRDVAKWLVMFCLGDICFTFYYVN